MSTTDTTTALDGLLRESLAAHEARRRTAETERDRTLETLFAADLQELLGMIRSVLGTTDAEMANFQLSRVRSVDGELIIVARYRDLMLRVGDARSGHGQRALFGQYGRYRLPIHSRADLGRLLAAAGYDGGAA